MEVEVKKLLAWAGKTLTHRTLAGDSGDYDPSTGDIVVSYSDISFTGKIIDYMDKDVDGTNVLMQDRKCLCDPTNFSGVPKRGDKIIEGSTVYTVMNSREITKNDTVLIYECQIRA